jgi:hypothetical protein
VEKILTFTAIKTSKVQDTPIFANGSNLFRQVEHPIPEQFKTVFKGNRLSTTTADAI